MKTFAFIGAGSIAEALIQGWITKGEVLPSNIYVTNRSNEQRLLYLKERYEIVPVSNLEQLQKIDIIVLAMKPKDASAALSMISPFIQENAVIFSVLAGIAMQTIEEALGKRAIVRAMPNTSATIGLSATGIAFNEDVNNEDRSYFITLLEAIGVVAEVEENQLHAITALSGSGPAYIYYLLEAFEKVGLEYGLSRDLVRTLMVQTITGSAEMVKQVKEEPQILRQKVTSPGGTTEAAIATFEQHQFLECLASGIRSAEKKSRELAKGQ